MPATHEEAGLGRALAPLFVAALLFFALVGLMAAPVHASDDSNSGQLAQAPTVTPQQLNSALGALAQGTNDSQVQSLLAQFQSELNGKNFTGAASTLVQLQGLSTDTQSGMSPSLSALLQSLAVGNNGASINANTLASLLSQAPGSQPGASSQSAQRLSVDMQSLANLMQYANATMASALLQESSLLSQSAFTGSNGGPAGVAPITLPGLSGFSKISVPSIGSPSLSVGTPSAALPAIPISAFALPLIAIAAVAALFFFRRRFVGLIGTQFLPGMTLLKGGGDESGPVPTDPRGRIEYYFGRAVSLMARRGVSKSDSETHREFSSKCDARPERAHVGTISSLYEKAKFSGQEVGPPDASVAASSFLAMEKEGR